MYHQVCWVTGQLDNLSWEGHDKFLPSLCGQMWVGREAGYLYSLRIQPASLEHCFVEPALTAGGWLLGRSLPAMAWHSSKSKVWTRESTTALQVRWGAHWAIPVVRTGGLNTCFRVTERWNPVQLHSQQPSLLTSPDRERENPFNLCNPMGKEGC